jgi:valine dehydrogenase (NAD+)
MTIIEEAALISGATTSPGVFAQGSGHEQVVFCNDRRSGLRAIIAIHSTVLGPALGGTRFYPYGTEEAALADVLNLSRAMTYKSAVAGLDLGGGKAVIIGDPETVKSEELLRVYGRFVASLNGRYITACDVGTVEADMDVVARECAHVVGRSPACGGAGDTATVTSYGVLRAMRAAVEHVFEGPSLAGRRVGIEGVGKVGHLLVAQLLDEGAEVVICDVDERAIERVVGAHPEVDVVSDTTKLRACDIDIYVPCAMSGAIDLEAAATLRARVVCGCANVQIAESGVEELLASRDIVYVPDYVANAGGLIQAADELNTFDMERAKNRAAGIYDVTKQILQIADRDGVLPGVAAARIAEARMAGIAALRSFYL